MPDDNITLNARCHCGRASYSYNLPPTAFPLKSTLCHCNSCRHASGLLFATFAVIPSPHRPDFAHLTAYASSQALTRYFCPTCGAHMGNFESGKWEFATGVLDQTAGILERVQLWVEDTRDGGAAVWITPGAWPFAVYVRGRGSGEVTDAMIEGMVVKSQIGSSSEEKLQGHCHCGDVKFTLARSDRANGKYEAGLDGCTSCRTSTGFEITSWVFGVPRGKITGSDGGSSFDGILASTTHYKTSAAIDRYSCSRCGAIVFCGHQGRDPVDIGVGLLDAKSGARAEEWLDWKGDDECLEYGEDALDQGLVVAFQRGMQGGSF